MNTLVHIVRFCTRESVAHTQKEHKVYIIGLKTKSKIAKIGVYIIPAILISFWIIKICVYNMRQKSRNLHDYKPMI